MNPIQQLIEQSDTHEAASLLDARSALLERLQLNRNDCEAMELLTGIYYWLGAYAEDDGARESYLVQGVDTGKVAAASGQDTLAANFWYASCMSSLGALRGLLNSRPFFGPIEKHGKRALKIDETYVQCGPLRLMGDFYSKAPPAPHGPGDKKKGLELARRAVTLNPSKLANKVVLANAYLAARYFDESRHTVRDILAEPEPTGSRLSFSLNQAKARGILERLDRME